MKVCFIVTATENHALCHEEKKFWEAYYLKYFQSTTYLFDKNIEFDLADIESFFFGSEFPRWNLMLAAIAREEGCEVELCDYRVNGSDAFHQLPPESDIYCFSSFTQYHDDVLNVARHIKSQRPEAVFIIGGAHVSRAAEETLAQGCWNAVFIGESENTFRSFLKDFKATGKIHDQPGVLTPDSLSVAHRPVHDPVVDLSSLPMPAYDLLHPFYRKTFSVKVLCSRGCPFNCTFCVSHHEKLRNKSLSYIEQEMDLLATHIDFKEMYIYDDNFFLDQEYGRGIAHLLAEKKMNWSCRLRADMHGKIPFDKLYEWGCRRISVGGESADNKVLRMANKNIRVDDIETTCRIATDNGLNVHLYWMTGLPGETSDSARRTIDYAVDLLDRKLCNTAEYAIFVPYPGTDIHSDPEKYGICLRDEPWPNYRIDRKPVFDMPGRSAESIHQDWLWGIKQLTAALAAGSSGPTND